MMGYSCFSGTISLLKKENQCCCSCQKLAVKTQRDKDWHRVVGEPKETELRWSGLAGGCCCSLFSSDGGLCQLGQLELRAESGS